MGWNLPSGVETCMLPGNTDDDLEFDKKCERLLDEVESLMSRKLTIPEAEAIIRLIENDEIEEALPQEEEITKTLEETQE